MNDVELAQLFVEYASYKGRLKQIETQIIDEVLMKKETVKIAGVTATYYKPGFETPDYEGAMMNYIGEHPEKADEFKEQFVTGTKEWYNFKAACEHYGVTPEQGPEKPAKVVIK